MIAGEPEDHRCSGDPFRPVIGEGDIELGELREHKRGFDPVGVGRSGEKREGAEGAYYSCCWVRSWPYMGFCHHQMGMNDESMHFIMQFCDFVIST